MREGVEVRMGKGNPGRGSSTNSGLLGAESLTDMPLHAVHWGEEKVGQKQGFASPCTPLSSPAPRLGKDNRPRGRGIPFERVPGDEVAVWTGL